jgi:fluoride ion exporter CrcB/FEX
MRVLDIVRAVLTLSALGGKGVEGGGTRNLEDDFLLTTTLGFNRQLLANIDAIDAALIGILGAVVAFSVLIVDKIKELPPPARWIAVTLLATSGLLSFVGYAYGFLLGEAIEGPRPLFFIPDFARNGPKAIARALRSAVQTNEHNRRVRTLKRTTALVAIGMLIGATAVVAYTRLMN